MNYETITVRPLTGALGAEIGGVDLRTPLGNRQWSEIHQAFLAHCAIYIRDQLLAPPDMLRFARYFAEPAFYPFVEGLPDYPQIFELRKEPDQKENVGGAWHSDTTYTERPPIGTMLYAREVPEYGGDTMVANQYLAYETLSPGMRAMLDGLTGIYSARMNGGRGRREENKYMKMRDTDKADNMEAEHPVVRTHPETGRKAIFVNPNSTVRIDDVSEAESDAILNFLYTHVKLPDFQCRVEWDETTLVFLDNRACQHYAVPDYDERRVLHRVTIKGDRPT
jgi:taurine dioxygenase